MVTTTHEIIKFRDEDYVSVRLPESIQANVNGCMSSTTNTIMFKPDDEQRVPGTLQLTVWFVNDIRDRFKEDNPLASDEDLMNVYLSRLRLDISGAEKFRFNEWEWLDSILHSTNGYRKALLDIALNVYGSGIMEYACDALDDVYIHRVKTEDKTYIRINRQGNPLFLHAAPVLAHPALHVVGLDHLKEMLLDITESPEELFKIGAYDFPRLLRRSRILREWRIGRELDIVEDFTQLPY